jgi:ribonucleoside-diphosphate reductase alpha chain
MQVIKRDGSTENFNINKIEKVISFACENAEDKEQFLNDLKINLKNNMDTRELQRILIQTASEKVNVHDTKWDAVASKLYLYNLIKEASLNRNHTGAKYGNFHDLLVMLTEKGLYHPDILKEYSKEEVDELGKYIKHKRDYLLSFIGITTLAERYLIKGHDKEIYELPQEAYMGVAMFLGLAEKTDDRLDYVKKFYDTLSKLEMTVATPTMSNARKPFNQLSSCFIGTCPDSLEGIYHTLNQFSQVSKHGGGFGLYLGKVRAQNSDIRGFKNTSGGVIPWIRLFNDTAVAVDQLGVRSGAISITLDIWHKDIQDFLQLKTNNGDERRKAHDVFPSVSIPDVFMTQVKKKGKFYLFCPHQVKNEMGFYLEDSWGAEFEEKYWACVANEKLEREEVKAMDLLKQIVKSTTETGTPFMFFRDAINKMNPNKHAGMIYSSNLCHEIAQNMKEDGPIEQKLVIDEFGNEIVITHRASGDFVVCNLSSLNLGRTHKEEDLARVVPLAIRMMDNVITLNFYPVESARATNKRYRAVGLGTFDYHHMLAMNGITWESDEHLALADKVFEDINYYAIKASAELGKERGSYAHHVGSDWQNGDYFDLREYKSERWDNLREKTAEAMRNGYLIAIAPNGASANYGGGTQSVDPIYDKFFLYEKKNSICPSFPPDITEYFWYYKEAHLIDQMWSVKACATRQRHIDQSQSFNLYITPETKSTEIAKLYVTAWSLGVKTIYYTRSRSVEVEDCVSCAA